LVVQKLLNAPTSHVHSAPNVHSPPRGFSQEQENPPPADPPLPNLEVDQEDAVAVPDAQSGPNEFGICPDAGAHCRIDDVGTTTQEIPVTQNNPSKCRSNTIFSFIIHPYSIPLSQRHL
jgi:hypothetical protein